VITTAHVSVAYRRINIGKDSVILIGMLSSDG